MNERERIEKVKDALGLTARQFAAEIHVQPGTISNMMAGRNNPSLEVMKRIMERVLYPVKMPVYLIYYHRIRRKKQCVRHKKKSRK